MSRGRPGTVITVKQSFPCTADEGLSAICFLRTAAREPRLERSAGTGRWQPGRTRGLVPQGGLAPEHAGVCGRNPRLHSRVARPATEDCPLPPPIFLWRAASAYLPHRCLQPPAWPPEPLVGPPHFGSPRVDGAAMGRVKAPARFSLLLPCLPPVSPPPPGSARLL